MYVESIQFDHFRNYDRLSLDLDRGINLFYGANAQGKTNILEAVYLCGTTRSHRGARDREMIQFSHDESHIRMQIQKNEVPYRIDLHLKKNKSKGIAINGVPIHKAAELIGLCNFVFFSPEDLNMIKNGPSERRKFLDTELCQLDKIYFRQLENYNKILLQRNRLLKDAQYRQNVNDLLDVLDLQMVEYGSAVIHRRKEFVDQISELLEEIHGNLSGKREKLEIQYEYDVGEEQFLNKITKNREKDMRTRMSNTGPHRDDLGFLINGVDIRRFGSQGQQRTAALALKLSEIEIVKRSIHDTPVLLLDDVLSELDSDRQRYLLDEIQKIQTLITCTGMDEFVNCNFQIDKTFQVEAGGIK